MIVAPHRLLARLAPAIAAATLLSSSLAAQEPVPTKFEEMKPYTETIPGTDIKFEMVPVPGGKFLIGSPDTEEGRGEDEGPQREIEVGPYWMGKFEVTWEEYDQFAFQLDLKKKQRENVDLTAQPETEKKADAVTRPTPPYADETFGFGRNHRPAICITHHSAMEYTRWLSEKTGKLYRLPTEAEWEHACRAGTTTAYHFGDDPAKLEEYDWFFENCEGPQPVGKKKPNPWGLFDMHGNVAEWCLDHYVADRYEQFPEGQVTVNPVILPDEKEYSYSARGGSWDFDPEKCRSAARLASDKEWSVQDPQRPQSIWWHTDATFVGFRVIRPLNEVPELVGLKSKVVKKKGTK